MAPLKLKSLIEGFMPEKKWSVEEKRAALQAIGEYNKYGKLLSREQNLMEIAHSLGQITEAAERFTASEIEEGGKLFDGITIKRNMGELRKITEQFNKLAQDAHVVEQRMLALYEDGGKVLERYFEINEINEETSPAVSKL